MSAAAPDPEQRFPERTIADGRRTLGFLFRNEDGSVSATDADGVSLGVFPKLNEARDAILAHDREARHG